MRLISICSIIIVLIFSENAMAQPASIGCIDKAIRMQAEELKSGFTKHGMEVYKDANVTMESDQPYPVAVQLKKGVMYQIIFVGSQLAKDIRMELFDGDDKKLGEKLMKKTDPNYIIYSFIPEKTDIYLVVLSQHLKNQAICSSITILQPPSADKKEEQQGTVPSENRYNNPRYIDKNGQPKNTGTKQNQDNNVNKTQNTNPRYVPQNQQQPKTNENYNNPRYKPQSK